MTNYKLSTVVTHSYMLHLLTHYHKLTLLHTTSLLQTTNGAYSRKKGHACDFSEKGQKRQKRAKYLKIWAKMYKVQKYFEKGQPPACNYRMHDTARICPDQQKNQDIKIMEYTFLQNMLLFLLFINDSTLLQKTAHYYKNSTANRPSKKLLATVEH